MRLPDFLIIGAMKAGTTTLFRDLAANPAIYFPLDKEPGNLESDHVLSPSGAAAYAALYGRAKATQLLGDASTTYSKLPDIPGVAARARQLLGPATRIIYLVREPVARAISHHHHILTTTGRNVHIDAAARSEPSIVAYGRYWMQLGPWLDAFGHENIHVQVFEDYVERRRATIEIISRFLGVPTVTHAIDPATVHNKGDSAHVQMGSWRALIQSRPYQEYVRPRLSLEARHRLRSVLLPKSPPRPAPPSPATVDFFINQFQPDAHELANFLGRKGDLWDFDSVRNTHNA